MANEILKPIDDQLKQLERWGEFATRAGVLPRGTTAYQAMAIIQTGREMGLQPMQSLRSMNFINGRLTMSVQLQLALAKRQGVEILEIKEGDGFCEVELKRGEEKVRTRYTREMAKKAGLNGKDNYIKYEPQMLRWRSMGDNLRLIAPDLALLSPEEAETLEPEPLPPVPTTAEIVDKQTGEISDSTLGIDELPSEHEPEVLKMNDKQRKKLFATMSEMGWLDENHELLPAGREALWKRWGYRSSKEITAVNFDPILQFFSVSPQDRAEEVLELKN